MSHDPLAGLDEEGGKESARAGIPEAQETAAGEGVTMELPDALTIAEVGDFHARLLGGLADEGQVRIDGSAVEVVDGAGVQLLAALVKELVGKSCVVSWSGISESLERAIATMGLAGMLQIENAAKVD